MEKFKVEFCFNLKDIKDKKYLLDFVFSDFVNCYMNSLGCVCINIYGDLDDIKNIKEVNNNGK